MVGACWWCDAWVKHEGKGGTRLWQEALAGCCMPCAALQQLQPAFACLLIFWRHMVGLELFNPPAAAARPWGSPAVTHAALRPALQVQDAPAGAGRG